MVAEITGEIEQGPDDLRARIAAVRVERSALRSPREFPTGGGSLVGARLDYEMSADP